MRIVHLVIGADFAGGQAVALQLARAARARDHAVSFVAPRPGEFVERARADGFDVELLDVGRLHRIGGLIRLARLLRRARADILHTHTLASANVVSRVAARLASTKVVAHLHIENTFRPATRLVVQALDNATARLCARLVAVSEDTRRAYERQGYPPRIDVVYNGVDPLDDGAPPSLRAQLALPHDAFVVGEVARLCDVKGQRELIAAIADVPDAHVVLVGADLERGGAFQRELEREAERRGVSERVRFAGRREDAAALVREFDVFALPSWTEGLPLVVLEAMAQRRPVVATPVGGTPEVVVDGETGLLVPPRDPPALANALRRLLDDPELRQRLGEAAFRRVSDRFSTAEMERRVLQIYDEVAR